MTSSVDENSALKRNSVHQTRLSLELQQLEKDRSIRLREMQKASQVFARRQEQIQGIREKAIVRRVTSAPAKKESEKPSPRRNIPSSESPDNNSPFVTTTAKLQKEPRKRQLQRTMTMPLLTDLPSHSNPTQFTSSSGVDQLQRGLHSSHSQRRGTLLEEKPADCTRIPMYSRNFCNLRCQRRDTHQTSAAGKKLNPVGKRRDSAF